MGSFTVNSKLCHTLQSIAKHPGFKYFSVSFGILLVFIFIGISGLVFMYKVTNRIYKLIETANLAKEIFFIADTVQSKIGKTNMAFL